MAAAAPSATVILDSQPSQDRRARPRARNWTEIEMMCLAQSKKTELELDVDNVGQRRFLTSVQKWNDVALFMSSKGYTDRSGVVCNTKWNNLFGDWKAIRDFVLSSGGTSYYNMTKNERLQAKLVPKFSKDLYDLMDSFCMQRPCMTPASVFDSGRTSSMTPPATAGGAENRSTAELLPRSPSQTVTNENGPVIVLSPDNCDPIPLVAPGETVRGSTGRIKRRRTVDILGVLKSSHDDLIVSLDKQMTQRNLFYDKQFELEKQRINLEKEKVGVEKAEQMLMSEDRRAMVSVFKEMANAMNILAHRHTV